MKNLIRINELVMFVGLAKFLHGLDFDDENFNQDKVGFTVADIACDHGYIGYELIKNKIADKVIFSDISIKSLEKAMNLIKNSEYLQFSEFKIGDGVEVLDGNIFASVIAGIGGREIVKILKSDHVELSKFYILQTSQDDVFLRMKLKELGFYILCDKCMLDNKHVYHTFLVSTIQIQKNDKYLDELVLNYFCKQYKQEMLNLNQDKLEKYFNFVSDFYGKNNMILNNSLNLDCINFEIERFTRIMMKIETEKISDYSDSMKEYLKEIKQRLDALDKIKLSIL